MMHPAWFCRASVAFVWAYHGLVPKLLGPHPDEMTMALSIGVAPETAKLLSYASGVAEILLAICIMKFGNKAWPLQLSMALMAGLLAFALIFAPYLALGAFNPVTTNLCVFVLAWIGLKLSPTAAQR